MPDTSRSRAAIRLAYEHHRNIMGGLSMAELKLLAAGGLLRDDDPLPYTEGDPVWFEHARDGLDAALAASLALTAAIRTAYDATNQDRRQAKAERKNSR